MGSGYIKSTRLHYPADSAKLCAIAPPWATVALHEDRFARLEIIEYRLDDHMQVAFNTDNPMVEMLLHDQPTLRLATLDKDLERHPVGSTAFFCPQNRFMLNWKEQGAVRAARCHFKLMEKTRTFTQDELVTGVTLSSPKLARHLNQIVAELCNPGFESRFLLESLARQVAVELGRFFRSSPAIEIVKLSDAQVAAINRCIGEDGAWPSIEMLAKACHVSKRHFFRLFRHTMNISPADYVMFYRIEQAKRLLRDNKLIIKQIAHSCGFSSASAFSAAFRRATGFSPRSFQKAERLQ